MYFWWVVPLIYHNNSSKSSDLRKEENFLNFLEAVRTVSYLVCGGSPIEEQNVTKNIL